MYQNVTEGTFMLFDEKFSKSSQFCFLEPGLYSAVTDTVDAMKHVNEERHNRNDSCFTAKVSRKTWKVEICLANGRSVMACFVSKLGHNYRSNVGDESGVMLTVENFTNQNLLKTLSAYTHSRYTRTWLSTLSLVTRKTRCCVAFLSFQSSKLETI